MKRRIVKTKKSIPLSNLDKQMSHLEKTVRKLTETVDNLAEATAKGFANTTTKQDIQVLQKDFEELGDRIDRSLENYTKIFRGDYDELSARVKRLEVTVFKH